jgi:hypothetical protein
MFEGMRLLLLIDCAYFVVGFTSKIMMNLLEARNFNHGSVTARSLKIMD